MYEVFVQKARGLGTHLLSFVAFNRTASYYHDYRYLGFLKEAIQTTPPFLIIDMHTIGS